MTHWTRNLLLVGVLALGAPAAVLPWDSAQAQEDPSDPAYEFYEEQKVKILKAAGNKVWDAAEQAKRRNLWQFAREQAERALTFDPDQEDAREFLGFEKSKGDWAKDQETYDRIQGLQNTRGERVSEEAFEKLVQEWKDKYLKKADEYVAERYAKLGDTCAKKGYPLQAQKGYEYALRLDRENKRAHKGLGHEKFGEVWVTKKQKDAIENAAKAAAVDDDSEWDSLFGTKLNKVESEHFRLESAFDVELLLDVAEKCEIAYAYYLADFGYDPTNEVLGRKARFCLMVDEDQWNKYVDRYSGGDEFTRKMGGTSNYDALVYGNRNREGHGIAIKRDSCVYNTIKMLNRKVFGLKHGAWIDEGLAYYYTVKVLGTNMTHAVAKKTNERYGKTETEGGIKDWGDTANWKPNVHDMVTSERDVELRKLLVKPITQLDYEASIKAWSVITWMMDEHRELFLDFMKSAGKSTSHDMLIQNLWGQGLEEIDSDWRAYVRRNY